VKLLIYFKSNGNLPCSTSNGHVNIKYSLQKVSAYINNTAFAKTNYYVNSCTFHK